MAIVKMKKLTVVGLLEERDTVLNQLERLQCVDISTLKGVERTPFEVAKSTELSANLEKVIDAIKVSEEVFLSTAKKKADTFGAEEIVLQKGKFKVSHTEFATFYKNQGVYKEADEIIFAGDVLAANAKELDILKAQLTALQPKEDEEAEPVAVKQIETLTQKIATLNDTNVDLTKNILVAYAKNGTNLKIAHDSINAELVRIDTVSASSMTKETFMFTAWVPFNKTEHVQNTLEKASPNLSIEFDDPSKKEVPPTLSNNPKLLAPFESVINMYSPPQSTKRDPIWLVGITYWILFGAMLGDAAYGLILLLGVGGYLLIKKPKGGMATILKVLAICGLSTLVWGALFGSWFGIPLTIDGIAKKDGGIPVNGFAEFLLMFCVLEPLNSIMEMMVLCLCIGAIHLSIVLCYKFVTRMLDGEYVATAKAATWAFILLGLVFLILSGAVEEILSVGLEKNALLQTIGLIMMVLALASVVAGAIVDTLVANNISKKKVVGGKLVVKLLIAIPTGFFMLIVNSINYLSDLFSYLRILGLGLATGIFSLVFYQLALVVGGGSLISPLALIVFAFGHVINMGLSLLGCYIQACRLQFVEAFGKFYGGGGTLYAPYGNDYKFITVE